MRAPRNGRDGNEKGKKKTGAYERMWGVEEGIAEVPFLLKHLQWTYIRSRYNGHSLSISIYSLLPENFRMDSVWLNEVTLR